MAACPGLRGCGVLPSAVIQALPADRHDHGQRGPVLNVDGERRIHHHAQGERGLRPGPGEELRQGIHVSNSRRWSMLMELEAFIVYCVLAVWSHDTFAQLHLPLFLSPVAPAVPVAASPTPHRSARGGADRFTKHAGTL